MRVLKEEDLKRRKYLVFKRRKYNDAISRSALLEILGMTDFADCIRYAPALDVVPVVHARWKMTDSPYCSHCNHIAVLKYRYCPNCGAKMDGDGHDSGQ